MPTMAERAPIERRPGILFLGAVAARSSCLTEASPRLTPDGERIGREVRSRVAAYFLFLLRYEPYDELASANLLMGKFPDDFAQIGCPPSTGKIPSNSCTVAGDSVEAVVTVRDIVEELRLPNERSERIQFKIQKA